MIAVEGFQPAALVALAAVGGAYVVAVRRVRRGRPASAWSAGRTASFLSGVAVMAAALGPPLDGYADRLFSVHMVQHLLLVQVAAPLLLLGRPVTLALAAAPHPARRRLASLAHGPAARALASPALDFGLLGMVLWVSHFTSWYEAALSDDALHALEHLAYLVGALLFWWPVIGRDPGAARLSHPGRILYLFLSMPVQSLLGFVIASAGHVLYPHYAAIARTLGASAIADQRLGGTLMWEGSMLVSVVALSAVLVDWMAQDERLARRADARLDREARAAVAGASEAEVP
ncbi:MAG TPA: cytochrome c oxidase assembly protein [Actinomycetota bacterium]|nr:cytochrome c oxidase assembly protein [Actinomycetota bacterium]